MNSVISTLVTVLVVIAAIVYILSIAYVIKDARQRGAKWKMWGAIALIPIVGFIAWCVARPPLTAEDRDEQDLEIALKRRQLMRYGECSHCGYPVEAEYVMCPHCHTRLKNLCPTCRHALNPEWSICPYCTTMIYGNQSDPSRTGAQTRQRTRSRSDATGARRRVN